jgi:hypothetical protein
MSRRLFASLVALVVALALPASALAQEYLFAVDKEVVDVSWNADGTESIEYTFTFTPQPGSHVIDFVDVGMPVDTFDMSTASADVNGTPVNVSQSDYQGSGSGFAVVLGSSAIQPGQTGSVHVLVGRVSGVLHPDSNDNKYASAVFGPTYFGSQYVVGNTDLTVTLHLPPGIKPEEPKYHMAENWPGNPQPQAGLDNQGNIAYTWSAPDASASKQYTFGASFPKSYVPAGAIVTAPAFDLSGLIGVIVANLGTFACLGFFGFMFIGLPIISAVQGRRRKLQYIPPRIGIEGHGIKRGLTAVEAAILMEQPLDKVMTMTLFGVIKKGAAQVITRDPLKIQVTDPLPADLHDYELAFLKAMKIEEPRARQTELQNMMVALVKAVGEKMKGFSSKETQDYYKNIMEQAWAQVEAAQTPEVKGEKFDQNLEWTMLDRDYNDRSRRVFSGPIFAPMWWGNYDPGYRPMSTVSQAGTSVSVPSIGRGSGALPGADLAASVVGGVQTFSGKVLGDLNTFTSRVTNVTNPPPPPSTSSYRGGSGGHSCACACACAGCACACAGGGR